MNFAYHEDKKNLLKIYIDNAINSKESKISFFVISGPKWIKKSDFIKELSQEILGNYFINDFLYIQDFSKELWKTHNIPVAKKESSEKYKTLLKDHDYIDLGTREINNWLVQSGFWKTKIIFIENIERMTGWAINAFLKSCEEPLKWRIIIASTSNKSKVIDTVLSRAITIKVNWLNQNQLLNYCKEKWYFQSDDELKKIVCKMSMGTPNFIDTLYQLIQENANVISLFKDIPKLHNKSFGLYQKIAMFDKIKELWLDIQYIDMIIQNAIEQEYRQQAEKWVKVKKMYDTNIKKENLFLYGLI